MNTTTTFKRGIAGVITTAAFFAVTACGVEVAPPAQDIGGVAEKETDAPEAPRRTSERRMDFGDDYGEANPRSQKARDSWKGSGNRMEFGDKG